MEENIQNPKTESSPIEASHVEQIPPTPPPVKPKHSLPILIAGIVLFLVLIGTASAAYLMISKPKSSQQPTTIIQKPTPTPNPTANWKTYNDPSGYSYQYPSNWYSPTEVFQPQTGPVGGGQNSGFHVSVVPNNSNLNIKEFAQKQMASANQAMNPPPVKIIETPSYFSNKNIVITNGFPGGGIELLRAYIPHGNIVYEISADGVVGEETGLKILSTFKFN